MIKSELKKENADITDEPTNHRLTNTTDNKETKIVISFIFCKTGSSATVQM